MICKIPGEKRTIWKKHFWGSRIEAFSYDQTAWILDGEFNIMVLCTVRETVVREEEAVGGDPGVPPAAESEAPNSARAVKLQIRFQEQSPEGESDADLPLLTNSESEREEAPKSRRRNLQPTVQEMEHEGKCERNRSWSPHLGRGGDGRDEWIRGRSKGMG